MILFYPDHLSLWPEVLNALINKHHTSIQCEQDKGPRFRLVNWYPFATITLNVTFLHPASTWLSLWGQPCLRGNILSTTGWYGVTIWDAWPQKSPGFPDCHGFSVSWFTHPVVENGHPTFPGHHVNFRASSLTVLGQRRLSHQRRLSLAARLVKPQEELGIKGALLDGWDFRLHRPWALWDERDFWMLAAKGCMTMARVSHDILSY